MNQQLIMAGQPCQIQADNYNGGADLADLNYIVENFDQQLRFARQQALAASYWFVCAQILFLLLILDLGFGAGLICTSLPADRTDLDRWLVFCVMLLNVLVNSASGVSILWQQTKRAFAFCTRDSVQFNHRVVHTPHTLIRSAVGGALPEQVVFPACAAFVSLVLEAIGAFFSSECRLFFLVFFLSHLLIVYHLLSIGRACALLSQQCPAEQNIRKYFHYALEYRYRNYGPPILQYFHYVLDKYTFYGPLAEDVLATDDAFFRFAFWMLGSDYCCLDMGKYDMKMLIVYMYAHKQGVHFVQTYMDAEDEREQVAAVRMVGFWADKDVWAGVGRRQPNLVLPEALYMKLKEKTECPGNVGSAAYKSLDALRALKLL